MVEACSTIAPMIFGWQCPWFTAEYADKKSKYLQGAPRGRPGAGLPAAGQGCRWM